MLMSIHLEMVSIHPEALGAITALFFRRITLSFLHISKFLGDCLFSLLFE
jgi:hypothetical protein